MQELPSSYNTQGDKGIRTVNSEQCLVNQKGKTFAIYSSLFTANFFKDRPVALTARASDSKSEGWGFKSLLACQKTIHGLTWERRVRVYGEQS